MGLTKRAISSSFAIMYLVVTALAAQADDLQKGAYKLASCSPSVTSVIQLQGTENRYGLGATNSAMFIDCVGAGEAGAQWMTDFKNRHHLGAGTINITYLPIKVLGPVYGHFCFRDDNNTLLSEDLDLSQFPSSVKLLPGWRRVSLSSSNFHIDAANSTLVKATVSLKNRGELILGNTFLTLKNNQFSPVTIDLNEGQCSILNNCNNAPDLSTSL